MKRKNLLRVLRGYLLVVACILAGALIAASCDNGGGDDGETKTKKVTITFNTDGGSPVASVEIDEGGKLPADYFGTGSKVPAKANYTFNGWLNGATPVTAATTFTQNATLIAQWTLTQQPGPGPGQQIQQVTVSFDLNLDDNEIGTPPKSVVIENGTALGNQYPPDPVRAWTWDGAFEFQGWYSGTVQYTKDKPITSTAATFALVAEWKDNRIFTLAPAIHPGRHLDEAYPDGFSAKAGVEFTISGLKSNVEPGAGVLTAQWYRTEKEADARLYVGKPVGPELKAPEDTPYNISLKYDGTEPDAGDYWYWVEVTNTNENATEGKTNVTRTMNQLKVVVTVPTP
jgi:uncharacterized repeat protein (TIGR02543 family)